jgi:ubiquinone biosynthesis protein UbiJ
MEFSGQALAGILNHLIVQTPGGTSSLARQAGRKLAIDAIITRHVFLIRDDGQLSAVPDAEAEAEATIRLTPDLMLRLPFEGKAAFRSAPTEGDADLLSAFNDVFQNLSWDAEADLARVFGPVIGFRLAEAGRSFSGWLGQATLDTAKALAEYATEENPILASPLDIKHFNAEVDTLRDDVARLEARLARLEKPE